MKKLFLKSPFLLIALSLAACGQLESEKQQATSSNVTADGCYPMQMAGTYSSADAQKLSGFSICPVATNVKAVHIKYAIPAGGANVCFIPYNYSVSSSTGTQAETCLNLGASGTQVLSWGLTYNAIAVVEKSNLNSYKTALSYQSASSSLPAYMSSLPAYAIVKFR